ncbi:MAG: glycosyltransferase family 2 protein [Rikenellaceae bacterium]
MLKVSGSIVLYNNQVPILKKAINSFLNTNLDVRLYLIDNSPTNKLKDICHDQRIIYIHNPSNPGFGAAHNIALKDAMKKGIEYHLVLNPDVYFNDNVILKLKDYMDKNPDIGNIMPKILYPNGDIQYLCKLLPTPYDWIGRRFNPFTKIVEKRNEVFELRFTNYDKIMEVPYLSGCFMFLRLSAIEEIGLFDEKIFMYGEETDLCRRLIKGGYKTIYYPHSTIYHYFEKGSHKSWRLTRIGMQSAIYYFNKWGWFIDKERKKINRDTLKKLGYRG